MKLSEFKSTPKNQEKKQKKVDAKANEDIKSMYEKYKDYDSKSLMHELFKNVEQQKSEGSFDFDKLQSQVQQMLPYLTIEQQKNLMTILSQLK